MEQAVVAVINEITAMPVPVRMLQHKRELLYEPGRIILNKRRHYVELQNKICDNNAVTSKK